MSKSLAILLVVSLAFNAMFAIGYFRARSEADPADAGDPTADMVAEKLGLSDAQRDAFVALRKTIREKSEELNQAALLAQEELWIESCDASADPQRIETLKDDLFELRHARRELGFEQFSKFLELLTPEQRGQVQERLLRPRPPPHRWGRRFGRFDENGDGTLSREERQKAIEGMRERVGPFRGGPPGGPRGKGRGRGRGRGPGRHGPPPMFRGDPPRPYEKTGEGETGEKGKEVK